MASASCLLKNFLIGMPKELGRAKHVLADRGYLSDANVEHCAAAKIKPLIAMKRERHNVRWKERFAAGPKGPPASASAMEQMAIG